jgi:hypothetical protein
MASGWIPEFAFVSVNYPARSAGGPQLLDRCNMNLMIWLPAMIVLGMAAFGLMFACVSVCDKI